jgi:hypothetical protein
LEGIDLVPGSDDAYGHYSDDGNDYSGSYDGYGVTTTRLCLRLQLQLEGEKHARGHQSTLQKQKGKWHRDSRG